MSGFGIVLTVSRLAQAAITTGNIAELIRDRSTFIEDSVHVFSDKVEIEVS